MREASEKSPERHRRQAGRSDKRADRDEDSEGSSDRDSREASYRRKQGARAARRLQYDSDSDGTTGQGDSSSASSSGRQRARRTRRQGNGNQRETDILLRELVVQVSEENSRRRRKDREKASLLVGWSDEQKLLFRCFAARNWKTPGRPRMGDFAKDQFSKAKITRSIRMIRDKAEDQKWRGRVDDAAWVGFLRDGWLAPDGRAAPGGFTAFMCRPGHLTATPSQSQREQQVQDMFGDGKINTEEIRRLTKPGWHLPKDLYETMDQLRTTADLLDALTRDRGLPSEGYRHGFEVLGEYRREFHHALMEDNLLMVKFTTMVDRAFQRFCSSFLRCVHSRDPVLEARDAGLKGSQVRSINASLRSFLVVGTTFNVSLPLAFLARAVIGRESAGRHV